MPAASASRTVLFCLATVLAAAGATACEQPPPPVADLDLPAFYGAASSNRLDPKQQAKNAAAGQPLTDFLEHVTHDADAALASPDLSARAAAGECAVEWLAAWAKGNAWLGRIASQQGEFQRIWDLAGLSLTYLKVAPHATAAQRATIEPWLLTIAHAARRLFDDPDRQRNNLWYWLGLGLAGTALGTHDAWAWNEARAIVQDAANAVTAQGALPLELARGPRAVHYHAFSAMPLIVLAELGAARGEDWYALADGALHRLVALTARGLDDPSIFARLAGIEQEPSSGSGGTGWLPLYARRFPARLAGHGPTIPTAHRWTGGDVLLLRDAFEPRALP